MSRVKIKDLKAGQTFWERYLEFVALEDAWRHDEGWLCLGQLVGDPSDLVIRFYVKDGHEHYGPDLYNSQAYMKAVT